MIYLVDHRERKIIPLLLYGKSYKTDVTAKELKMLLIEPLSIKYQTDRVFLMDKLTKLPTSPFPGIEPS